MLIVVAKLACGNDKAKHRSVQGGEKGEYGASRNKCLGEIGHTEYSETPGTF